LRMAGGAQLRIGMPAKASRHVGVGMTY